MSGTPIADYFRKPSLVMRRTALLSSATRISGCSLHNYEDRVDATWDVVLTVARQQPDSCGREGACIEDDKS
jgi:hypothetical protein